MRHLRVGLFVLQIFTIVSCAAWSQRPSPASPETSASSRPSRLVEAVLLQINDIYEIRPLQGGAVGGLARVATLKRKMKDINPNTLLVLAGDFLSPSALGTAKVEGRELRGRQMIDSLATAGLDLAIFGNHEFDLREADLRARIEESKSRFLWLSGNVNSASGASYEGLPTSHIREFRSPEGLLMRVGFLAATMPVAGRPGVRFLDPIEFAKKEARRLRPDVDVLVALTHLSLAQDSRLALEAPEIDLIIGGHEHESIYHPVGAKKTPIAKADANAKTVYVHVLKFDPSTKRLVIDSGLRRMDESVAEDAKTRQTVETWMTKGFAGFRKSGFDPDRLAGVLPETLHGTEAAIRNRETNLSEWIGNSMLRALPGAEVALFTGGGIRIDDDLPPGPITEYDVIRVMPFPDIIVGYSILGRELLRVLEEGDQKVGTGDFVHAIGIEEDAGHRFVNGEALDEKRLYRVVTNTFLGDQLQAKYGARLFKKGKDSRRAFIDFLRRSGS